MNLHRALYFSETVGEKGRTTLTRAIQQRGELQSQKRWIVSLFLWSLLLFTSSVVLAESGPPFQPDWTVLQPGVEYSAIPIKALADSQPSDEQIHVLRINPERARFKLALASQKGGHSRTLQDWARRENLVAAINLGMYQQDLLSHVGYLKHGPHMNSSKWNGYKAALVLGPDSTSLPKAQLVDLDKPKEKERIAHYQTVVQNLRLIKAPGVSVWKGSQKGWSEAALAQDQRGNLLFFFVRAPLPMRDFIALTLSPVFQVVKLVHLDGGPPAGLSIHAKTVNLDLAGVSNVQLLKSLPAPQQAIPNILGVVRELPRPPALPGKKQAP